MEGILGILFLWETSNTNLVTNGNFPRTCHLRNPRSSSPPATPAWILSETQLGTLHTTRPTRQVLISNDWGFEKNRSTCKYMKICQIIRWQILLTLRQNHFARIRLRWIWLQSSTNFDCNRLTITDYGHVLNRLVIRWQDEAISESSAYKMFRNERKWWRII